MDSYMVDYEQCFVVCRNVREVHLQEVRLTQIPVDYVSGMGFG